MSQNYSQDVKIKNTLLLREKLKELPAFCVDYFRSLSNTTSSRTQIGYALDLIIFFNFLIEEQPGFHMEHISQFTIADLKRVTAQDIDCFMEYLSFYIKEKNGSQITYTNDEKGKARKLSAIRTMFSFFYKRDYIDANPSEKVDFPKLHQKPITRLEIEEMVKLLDNIETGENLSERQQKWHEHTKKRDLAIISLLLGTGIRVSECVGINLEHLDFENNSVKVTRKGGNEVILYFNDEVAEPLLLYLEEREQIQPKEGHENAFFLSLQNRRLTDRAIQKLVKKYALTVTSLKKISPHKLRSTFGTNLYRETGDIYLVADVLGHADVNTTKKHYAEIDSQRRRQAAKYVKLRKED